MTNGPLSAVKILEGFHDDVRYVLPSRQLGVVHLLGLIPLLFGLAFSGFAVAWMLGTANIAIRGGGFDWLFVLFGVPFLLAGYLPIFIGLAMLIGHSEIHLKRGQLRAVERAGPLWWTRARPLDQLSRLVVVSGTQRLRPSENDTNNVPQFMKELAGIRSEYSGKRPMMLAMGYPETLVQPLAEELAERCEADFSFATPIRRPEVAVEKCDDEDEEEEDLPTHAPAGTDIRCDHHADGLTIEVPPAGVWKGSKGLFAFSLLWCGFMALVSIFLIFAEGDGDTMPLAFVGLFWLVGIIILLSSINMGRRKSAIAVVGGTLMVIRVGLFGTKRGEWNRDQIEDVKVGSSGMEVNNVPVLELQIHGKDDKKFGLLSSRSSEELYWISGQVRRALKLRR